MARGPKIDASGNFWDAYRGIKKGNDNLAHQLLDAEYFRKNKPRKDSLRADMIDALAHGFPLYAYTLTWEQILAAAGTADALYDLYRHGQIAPVHIVHLEVELSPRLFPMADLYISSIDQAALLAAYAMEDELLMQRDKCSYHLRDWLSDRRLRAEHYFSTLEITRKMQSLPHS